MKKSWGSKLIFMLLTVISMTVLSACGKDNQIKTVEEFINLQINCETYKKVNEEQVKEKFLPYITEECFDNYLNNYFLYMYPKYFNQLKAESVQIKKIKCEQTVKNGNGGNNYTFQVKYTIISASKRTEMVDELSMKTNKEGKMTEIIILNTSDLVKKLFLDVKVQ